MTLWKDSTSSTTADAAKKHALAVEREQAFFNAERSGEVTKAIDLALRLERPGALLRVLTKLLENDYENGDARLRECVEPLHDDKLARVLKCVREWNTNGRTCHVAQHVLAAIFRTHTMEELSKIPEITQINQALRAYTERHRSRLERLYRGTFLVDTLLSRTGALVDDEESMEEVKRTHDTVDNFGFMRVENSAPQQLSPAPVAAAGSEDDEPADVADEDMAEPSEEDEAVEEATDEVREDDVIMGPPKKLQRLKAVRRLASGIEEQRKLMRDPSPRHTRSGKKLSG
jgi:U3 small nucleolar RNA-associated protein 13